MRENALYHAYITSSQIRYVFLDRDGVINQKAPEGEYIYQWNKFRIIPGVVSAITALNRSDKRVIVVTNQRGIALGLYTPSDVETLHSKLQKHLHSYGAHIDAFYYCPHDKDQCDCRKPKTGLFERAFRHFPEASPANSVMIGDSISDIEAARACGIPSIFILGHPSTQKLRAREAAALASSTATSLQDAVNHFSFEQ